MRYPAIPGRLLAALCHSIVAEDGRRGEAGVGEESTAARRLRSAMGGVAAPLRDGSLVAPEGHGQQLVSVSKTLEPFNRDESVHMLQLNAQARCVIQVVGLAAAGRPSLEDNRDHKVIVLAWIPEGGKLAGIDHVAPTLPLSYLSPLPRRAPQRIRNDRIVGCCFGRVAYGPALSCPWPDAAGGPSSPSFLHRCVARMNLAHRGHQP